MAILPSPAERRTLESMAAFLDSVESAGAAVRRLITAQRKLQTRLGIAGSSFVFSDDCLPAHLRHQYDELVKLFRPLVEGQNELVVAAETLLAFCSRMNGEAAKAGFRKAVSVSMTGDDGFREPRHLDAD